MKQLSTESDLKVAGYEDLATSPSHFDFIVADQCWTSGILQPGVNPATKTNRPKHKSPSSRHLRDSGRGIYLGDARNANFSRLDKFVINSAR